MDSFADFITFGKNIGDAITGFPKFITNTVGFSSDYPALAGESAGLWGKVVDATVALFTSSR